MEDDEGEEATTSRWRLVESRNMGHGCGEVNITQ